MKPATVSKVPRHAFEPDGLPPDWQGRRYCARCHLPRPNGCHTGDAAPKPETTLVDEQPQLWDDDVDERTKRLGAWRDPLNTDRPDR